MRDSNIRYCLIGDAGAIALATALHDNITLRNLNLLYNRFGDSGITAVAALIGYAPPSHTYTPPTHATTTIIITNPHCTGVVRHCQYSINGF
jgi:hypothetical protein